MALKVVSDIDVKGKAVILRAGLDVPLDVTKDLLDPERVTDDTRIRDIMPTLRYLIKHSARIILAGGWCGRPNGEDAVYSVAPVAKRLEFILKKEGLLRHPVLLAPDCFSDRKPRSVNKNRNEVLQIVQKAKEGQVVYLENVRFDPEANANDRDFASFIASLGDIYINENETQNHRPEATISTTPLLIASKGGEVGYGFKYAEVLRHIGGLKASVENQKRGPFVLALSGKKIETDPGITSKITVALGLLDSMRKGDTLLVGGAVSYTFILAKNFSSALGANKAQINSTVEKYNKEIAEKTKQEKAESILNSLQAQKSKVLKELLKITDEKIRSIIGNSYIRWGQEGEQIAFAYDVMCKCEQKGVALATLTDHVITDKAPNKSGILPDDAKVKQFGQESGIPPGWLGVSMGKKSLAEFQKIISNSALYLQSGPFSIEDERVEKCIPADIGTFHSAKQAKEKGGITIAAGGDTVTRVNSLHADSCFSIITSAGGATLELIRDGFSAGSKAIEESQKISESLHAGKKRTKNA